MVSSQGLRNEEIPVPKPASVYRAIALGDSITEGGGVELDGTFVKLLERSLQIENPEHAYDQAHLKPTTHQIVAKVILQALHEYELGPPL